MADPKHIGIIGTGQMAATMVQAMAHVPNLTPAGVLSSDADRGRAFSDRYALGGAFQDIEGFLAQEGLRGVYIANANPDHYSAAKAALQAGVPVLAEKPLTLTGAQTSELCDLSAQTGTALMENLWILTLPAYQALIGAVRDAAPVSHLSFDFSLPVKPETFPNLYKMPGGGVLYDRAVYGIAAAYAVLGPVQDMAAHLTHDAAGIATRAMLVLTHQHGARSVITVAFDAAGPNALSVATETQAFRVEPSLAAENLTVTHHSPAIGRQEDNSGGGGLKQTLKQAPLLRRAKALMRARPSFLGYGASPYVPVLQEFDRLLDAGLIESPVISHDLSRTVSKIIDSVMEQT